MPIRVLSEADVRSALPMADAIAAMRVAFAAASQGTADVPLRTHIALEDGRGTLTMPGVLFDPLTIGCKLLTLAPENPARGLPVIQGIVVVFDADTGAPAGVIDGTALTAVRTGAASGLATELLARADVRTAAIIGSGPQARTQLEAVCCVRPIRRAAVYSRDRSHAETFAAEMAAHLTIDDGVHVAVSAREACAEADVICTATPSTRPLVALADVAPGAHINAIGSYTPDMRELDRDLVVAARVVVDQVEAAMEEAGELIDAVRAGALAETSLVELGAIVTGEAPGRRSDDEVTVFKSVGLAVQDLVAARSALDRAASSQLGSIVPF